MGEIYDRFSTTYRDFSVSGVPASGGHEPEKADIRAIAIPIEAGIAAAALSGTDLTAAMELVRPLKESAESAQTSSEFSAQQSLLSAVRAEKAVSDTAILAEQFQEATIAVANQVDQAANSVLAASSAAATAVQARDAILDQLSDARVYVTKAEASADLANIPANGFVTVLSDETRSGHWVIYRKVSGALQFIVDRDSGRVVTLEQFGAVADCNRRVRPATGTPADAARDAATAALYLAGGGAIQLLGGYLLTTPWVLPNTNTQTTIGTQPSISISGMGCSSQGGKGDRWLSKTFLHWTAEGGDGVAKIDTRGIGTLTLADMDLSSEGLVKPFIHTTFTTIKRTRVGFVTPLTATDCREDAIVYGGTVDFETIPSFDRRSADCGFQGYGSEAHGCYYHGVRRIGVYQRYANSIIERDFNLWGGGNASSTGEAFFADGGNTFSVGNTLGPGLIEAGGYKVVADLSYCNAWDLLPLMAYDADDALFEVNVRVRSTCSPTMSVQGGLRASAVGGVNRRYLDDPANRVTRFASLYPDEASKYGAISAGDDNFPNRFGTSLFDAPGAAPIVFRSRQAEVATAFASRWRRSLLDATDPNGVILDILYGGALVVGGPQAGNIRNGNAAGAARGAGFFDSGRSWGFDRNDSITARREGGPMLIDSGTGGSALTVRSFGVMFRNHVDALLAEIRANGSINTTGVYLKNGEQVVGDPFPAIADNKTTEEKLALVLSCLRSHGLLRSS